jgi:alkanesulfonate monooxygenase SsuD/methylene tetrahydromethanopterin reductase-like flavin-dependent oxidoreductase (luciferase family)
VFLASAFTRTKTLRMGPLVYVLPLHHPLRVYEEICMLDHLSGGRLMMGIGRGGALIEHQRYGIDPKDAPAMYHEAFAVMTAAFQSEVVNFEGKYYRYRDYLVQAKPVQKPHPPIWYGAPSPDAIPWAAPRNVNVVSLGPAGMPLLRSASTNSTSRPARSAVGFVLVVTARAPPAPSRRRRCASGRRRASGE